MHAAGAGAATLFTDADRITAVSLGTTATIASGTVTAKTGANVVNSCPSSTLTLLVEQNNATAVAGTFTSGSFPSCALSAAGDFPWRFTIRGNGATSGANTVFANTTWEDVNATLWGVTPGLGTLTDASGSPPTDGVYTRQTTSTAASICFVLANAGTLSGPELSDGKIDATYCLEGETATTWSLGSPGTRTFLRTDPANLQVPGGGTLMNRSSDQARWSFTGLGDTLQCSTTTSDIDVGASGGATVTGTLTGLTLTGCSDSFPSPVTITTCAMVSPRPSVAFKTTSHLGGSATFGTTFVRCGVSMTPFACYYAASSLTGVYANSGASLTFNNAVFGPGGPSGTTDDIGIPLACGGGHSTFNLALTDITYAGTGTTVTVRTS
jgi:hypothetical protein